MADQSDLPESGRASFAVIIPHYEDVARLTLCLEALFDADDDVLADVEVAVVDNGSSQSLAELEARFPRARFLIEEEKGAAAARNKGVAETTAAYLFFLDADCIPGPDWLETAKDAVKRADLVGGRIDTFDETPPPRSGAEAFEAVFAFRQKAYVEEKGFSVSANLLTTRAVFNDTGGFVVGVSEDLDWCQRALAKGYQLTYADDLVVRHPSRQDWNALRKKWRRLSSEAFHLNGLSIGRRLIWACKACVVLLSLAVHAPKLLMSSKLDSSKERFAGLVTLVRLRIWRACYMLLQAMALRS